MHTNVHYIPQRRRFTPAGLPYIQTTCTEPWADRIYNVQAIPMFWCLNDSLIQIKHCHGNHIPYSSRFPLALVWNWQMQIWHIDMARISYTEWVAPLNNPLHMQTARNDVFICLSSSENSTNRWHLQGEFVSVSTELVIGDSPHGLPYSLGICGWGRPLFTLEYHVCDKTF